MPSSDQFKGWALQVEAPSAQPRFHLQPTQVLPPKRGEVTVRIAACSVNPIDVKRAQGHGQRLLRFKGAARFPLTLGNDFAGQVVALGPDTKDLKLGDQVFGLLAMGSQGSHATVVNASADLVRCVNGIGDWQYLCTLPYSYTTMRLALANAGLSRDNARGRRVLVHGASGGLGSLALRTLAAWGAHVTAVCGSTSVASCLALGAAHVLERGSNGWRDLPPAFDVTLNFADWSEEAWVVSRLKPGALGHASTVHPLLQNFDRLGWVGGAWTTWRDRSAMTRLARKTGGAECKYAWTVFKPVPALLDELQHDVETRGLRLPVALAVPLDQGQKAFDHARKGSGGRAILLATADPADLTAQRGST